MLTPRSPWLRRWRPYLVGLWLATGALLPAQKEVPIPLHRLTGPIVLDGLSDEPAWELPLFDEYLENMRSRVADLRNSERREAGAIKAALFLREFVDHQKKKWAHIDIAGTAWTDVDLPYNPAGGTGAIVRTMLTYLLGIR